MTHGNLAYINRALVQRNITSIQCFVRKLHSVFLFKSALIKRQTMRFLAISAAVFVIFAIVASSRADYKVVCYYNSTSWNRVSDGIFKPSNINASLCTHIVYEYAVLDSDTLTIQPQNATNDVDNSYYTQVTALRSSEVNVSISLGGWNDSTSDKYSQVLTNSTARSTFIVSIVTFIETYNFTGLDLDLRVWVFSIFSLFKHFLKEIIGFFG